MRDAIVRLWPWPKPPASESLAIDYDQPTAEGLHLRDALSVRSADFWLRLGQPEIALKELQTLPERARHHAWPLKIQLAAIHATNSFSA